MGNEKKSHEPLISHPAIKGKTCQCLRIDSLPPLPAAYRYASLSVEIVSDQDCETLTMGIFDEGHDPFVEIDTTGKLRFDRGDLALIGQTADALINLLKGSQDDRG